VRVLVACEESQEVCKAFRELGHEAYSCDIMPCSGGHPEWHIQCDVLEILGEQMRIVTQNGIEHWIDEWDLMIAHPPCTYISKAGACRMFPKAGMVDGERLKKGMEAKDFFMKLLNANIKLIAVENPFPLKIIELPKYTQIIQPYQFGHPFSKKTLLWLKGLPKLFATGVIEKHIPYLPSNTGGRKRGQKCRTDKDAVRNPKEASKTFSGIAKAMAEQWGKSKNEVTVSIPPKDKSLGILDTIL
jgi:hypothetical protein